MTKALRLVRPGIEERVINLVLDSLDSESSKRIYRLALEEFLDWARDQGEPPSKALVMRYKAELLRKGLAPATINGKLTAVRRLMLEAADNKLVDPNVAAAIGRVKGVRRQGTKTGNWLSQKQAQDLLDAPDANTLKGLRDRAVFAALLGCGLRRDELAGLTFAHLQQREGRWVALDIVGKGGKTRTVPMPSWVKVAVDEWARAADLGDGAVFRSFRKGDKPNHRGLTGQAIYRLAADYGERLGLPFKLEPHDLRRTHAKLAHKGGAPIEQIQKGLGHESIRTTELYLGLEQNLSKGPGDYLDLRLAGTPKP